MSELSREFGPRDPNRERTGILWTPEEERELLEEFDAGVKLEIIANTHQRSEGGILARLIRLNKVVLVRNCYGHTWHKITVDPEPWVMK